MFGVGAFAHSTLQILKDTGAEVLCYLTRDYGHYPPSLVAPTFTRSQAPNPVPRLLKEKVDLVLPMSIDWAQQPWAGELIASGIPILCPTGEALRLERERDFARTLCAARRIPFPESHFAPDEKTARRIVRRSARGFVLKNPLCGPTSPIHTIVCETAADTLTYLPKLDYGEGLFLQEYVGRAEAGHIAFVTAGEIHSLVTNQEYKRAYNGNLGLVAGAPLGGLVEQDPSDKYGLAKALLHPLRDWFREVQFHGPVQVTAARHRKRWHVLEYNVRIGVTSGAMILRMLQNPVETLLRVARNEPLRLRFKPRLNFGCSVTLAGYGYPYTQLHGPAVPIETTDRFDCDVWWNEVGKNSDGQLVAQGHRLADVIAISDSLPKSIARAYSNLEKIRSLNSYYRTDIGQSLWPPGKS